METTGAVMPMRRAGADAGRIAVSALHSAPVGIATGPTIAMPAPALLAQYNAAARAFRSRCSGLIAGAVSFVPAYGVNRSVSV